MSFSAQVKFDVKALDSLRKLNAAIANEKGVVSSASGDLEKKVGRMDADQNKRTFRDEAIDGEAKWKRLTPGYEKWKRSKVGRKGILKFTGDMWKSATTASHKDRIADIDGSLLLLGTKHELAGYHQDGFKGVVERTVKRKKRTKEQNIPGLPRTGVRVDAPQVGAGFTVSGEGSTSVRYVLRLPARPFIGKSEKQAKALRLMASSVILAHLSRVAGGPLGRAFAKAANALSREARGA